MFCKQPVIVFCRHPITSEFYEHASQYALTGCWEGKALGQKRKKNYACQTFLCLSSLNSKDFGCNRGKAMKTKSFLQCITLRQKDVVIFITCITKISVSDTNL